MGAVMAAWEGRGKTGALLSCIWVNEHRGQGVTMSVCVRALCVCAHTHAHRTQTQSKLCRNTSEYLEERVW